MVKKVRKKSPKKTDRKIEVERRKKKTKEANKRQPRKGGREKIARAKKTVGKKTLRKSRVRIRARAKSNKVRIPRRLKKAAKRVVRPKRGNRAADIFVGYRDFNEMVDQVNQLGDTANVDIFAPTARQEMIDEVGDPPEQPGADEML